MKLSELSFWWLNETKQYNNNDTTLITKGDNRPSSGGAGALRKNGQIDATGHCSYGGCHKVTLAQVLDGLDANVDQSAVLKKLKDVFGDVPVEASVKLNKEYTAIVTTRNIKVGCQTFSWDILDKLAVARAKLAEGR